MILSSFPTMAPLLHFDQSFFWCEDGSLIFIWAIPRSLMVRKELRFGLELICYHRFNSGLKSMIRESMFEGVTTRRSLRVKFNVLERRKTMYAASTVLSKTRASFKSKSPFNCQIILHFWHI